ncbi:DUF2326 domain-containing protein [Micromonospora sp. WMMD737]|uniref:DUF2326 domain-containing protein n=1 Tax=Micromonospora sp. WMMD737 TaxID=3404113 RepID=UPI003B92C2FC
MPVLNTTSPHPICWLPSRTSNAPSIDDLSCSLRINSHIDSDDSTGIRSMVIFCFDLTVSVLAHRARRAPDFLVHDSYLFDGVDDRQLAAALGVLSMDVGDVFGILKG